MQEDATAVFQAVFERSFNACARGEFAVVQVQQLTPLGDTYTTARFVVNFRRRENRSDELLPTADDDVNCTADAAEAHVRARLPDLVRRRSMEQVRWIHPG